MKNVTKNLAPKTSSLKILGAVSLISFLAMGCSNQKELSDSSSNDPVADSFAAGVEVSSGMADEASGASLAQVQSKPMSTIDLIAAEILIPKAYASSCVRAYADACVNGIKEVQFNNCMTVLGRSLNGWVKLTYSDSACSMAADGDTVTRTYDYSSTGFRGGVLSNSSENVTDYEGSVYGSGGRLTKTSAGWDLDILGKNKSFAFRNLELFNISVKTSSPIAISGGLTRGNRVMNGGNLVVHHNKALFTTNLSFQNLTWNNQCCHPVSGSIQATYSGSVTGSATLTFNGCGEASYQKDGLNKTVSLDYCE